MKFARIGALGQERPAIVDEAGRFRDLSTIVEDISAKALTAQKLVQIATLDLSTLPVLGAEERIGACVGNIGTFFCIGLNYARHAAETGSKLPPEPMVFNKALSSVCGANDALPIPPDSKGLDWEVELGLVIAKEAYCISEDTALDYVLGYFTANDVSEREFQKSRGGQFVKGKSGPNFAPIGPYLVSADGIADPQNLRLQTRVNGKVMQDSNTSDMIFSLRQIIANLSQYMRLLPGDVIITGTPEGVALGHDNPPYLQAGDMLEVEVEGLGAQRMIVKA